MDKSIGKIAEIKGIKYRSILIELINDLSEEERNILYSFNDSIHFFEIKERQLIFFFREIDLNDFMEKVAKLRKFENLYKILIDLIIKIEAIKSYGIRGKRRVYIDYDSERKVKGRKNKESQRGKFFYALHHKFKKDKNELPHEFENKIICGDSEEVLKKLPDNCVDLILTSPPYNFGLSYENHNDVVKWESYFAKLFSIFDECIRVLKYGGRIVVNVQPLFSDYIPIHHIISKFFMDKGLIWKGEIIWEKHNYNCKYTAWGSWKSPSNPYLKYSWEFLEIFCKGSLKHEGETDISDLTPDEFKEWVYARWDIAPERNMEKWGHPAMFPEELARRVIKLFSFVGDVVLDPFNGVGTTTKVAKELKRRFIGIDISPDYCKKAEIRLNQELPDDNSKMLSLFDDSH
jgi:DNA modification methylase